MKYTEPFVRETGLSRRAIPGTGPQGSAATASEPFNMAYLAMRGCCHANGVAQLHGRVSRTLVPRALPRLARGGGSRRPRHQRRPRPDLAFGAGQQAVGASLRRRRSLAGQTWRPPPKPSRGCPTNRSGTIAPRPARRSSITSAAARAATPRAERAGGDDPGGPPRARSERPDAGLRAAIRRVQAAEPAAWPTASDSPRSSATPSGRCRSSWPARRIPTTTAARR